jgi:cellulose synthase/poly-beta-1,6-N-acetylglucosamine synthase-like glycosyltransferase
MTVVATALFWLSLAGMVYVYAGYPLMLLLIGAIKRGGPRSQEGYAPGVTLVVSAYNEEAVIREKIQNSLALDYPRERLEVLVASDGSTDRTAAITAEYATKGVRLLHYPVNRGKNSTLNDVIPEARGDLIVFTDANGKFEPAALRKLARHFADPRVGCVCGELHYLSGDDNLVAKGYNVYWRSDQRL